MQKEIVLSDFVQGKPVTQGSKKGIYNPKVKRVWIKDQNEKELYFWRSKIGSQIEALMKRCETQHLPKPKAVALELTFFFMRPKGHFGSGKNSGKLKASAPKFFTKAPDLAKLARAVEDALTGIVYQDDSQVCFETLHKRYVEFFNHEGVQITVFEVKEDGDLPFSYEF